MTGYDTDVSLEKCRTCERNIHEYCQYRVSHAWRMTHEEENLENGVICRACSGYDNSLTAIQTDLKDATNYVNEDFAREKSL